MQFLSNVLANDVRCSRVEAVGDAASDVHASGGGLHLAQAVSLRNGEEERRMKVMKECRRRHMFVCETLSLLTQT